MIFQNIHTFSIILSILLILFVIYFFWIYKKNNKNILSIIFLALSVLFLIITLFSPRFGNYDKNISVDGGNILFVMDVSKSMNVFDIKYGKNIISRLQAEKLMISNFVENNTGNNYGLFAFAGETLELLPLTDDAGLFQTILNGVDKNNVSKYGSDFKGLFQIISDYIEQEENAGTVVIFTDGGEIENISLPQSLIQKIDKNNSQIILVGVGTQKGGYILDGEDVFGRPVYKIYNGQKVLSKMNHSGLKTISNKYSFTSTNLSGINDFDKIENIINQNVKKQKYEKNIFLARDISYIFIVLFMIFFTLFLVTDTRKN